MDKSLTATFDDAEFDTLYSYIDELYFALAKIEMKSTKNVLKRNCKYVLNVFNNALLLASDYYETTTNPEYLHLYNHINDSINDVRHLCR